MTAWQGKLISNKYYVDMGTRLDETGKMFGGWQKSMEKPKKKTPRR